MKSFFTSVLLMGGILLASAQDWRPIPKGHKAYYRVDSSQLISHYLRVDSQIIVNQNQVLTFNPAYALCDTCIQQNDYYCRYLQMSCIGSLNGIQFLQKQATYRPDGSWHFQEPGSLVIYPERPVGSRWLYDSTRQIMAVIQSSQWQAVFSQMDSVKLIQLSNGQHIEISKKHGLLRFPDSTGARSYLLAALIGPQTRGQEIFGFWESYDFQVGDVFQYYDVDVHYGDGWSYSYTWKEKILSKYRMDDTLFYDVDVIGNYAHSFRGGPEPSGSYAYQTTRRYAFSPDHPSNFHPGELYELANMYGYPPQSMMEVRSYSDKVFGPGKGLGEPQFIGDDQPYPILSPSHVPGFYYSMAWVVHAQIFHPGMGETTRFLYGFEYLKKRELQGYASGNITYGQIEADSFFTVSRNPVLGNWGWELYPNPGEGALTLRLPLLPHPFGLSVYNSLGQMVHHELLPLGKKAYIYLQHLPKGVYQMVLENKGRREIKRWVRK